MGYFCYSEIISAIKVSFKKERKLFSHSAHSVEEMRPRFDKVHVQTLKGLGYNIQSTFYLQRNNR